MEWSIDVPVRRAGAESIRTSARPLRRGLSDAAGGRDRALLSLQRDEGSRRDASVCFPRHGAVRDNEERPALFGLTVSGRTTIYPRGTLAGLTINTLPLLFEPRRTAKCARRWRKCSCRSRSSPNTAHTLCARWRTAARTGSTSCRFRELSGAGPGRKRALRAELAREIENTGYPLTIIYRILGGRLQINDLRRSAFSTSSMERMARHLRNVALQAAASPDAPAPAWSFRTRRSLLRCAMLRGPEVSHSAERIEEVFETQVAVGPDRLALRAGERSFTYAELDRIASSLGDLILAASSLPDADCARGERSPELVQGMWPS